MIEEHYDDTIDKSAARLLSVTAGQTVEGIDTQLDEGGSIAGHVTDHTDKPVAFVDVYFEEVNGDTTHWARTEEDGSYTVGGLPPTSTGSDSKPAGT